MLFLACNLFFSAAKLSRELQTERCFPLVPRVSQEQHYDGILFEKEVKYLSSVATDKGIATKYKPLLI